ncbi:response regulator receiver domain [Jeotgalibacillus aurantiacus]|uniref:response regulator receiver domain n=1 Tax=Jeotgalibacillus aurantiacus TaxID=2763266 RepID=UPI001D0B5E63|nr:response regulator receiver domain [Jeotgalibacillus aurantiacus]
MTKQSIVENIVKDYFNSAVIIDDNLELSPSESVSQETFSNANLKIGEYEFYDDDSKSEAAIASEINYNENLSTPFETYQELIRGGFVTLPWKYVEKDDINILRNALNNSKLLIVDWNLEPSSIDKSSMGERAIEFINSFVATKKGLKCAVIYTQEDVHSVQKKLEGSFLCKKILEDENGEDLFIFEEKENVNSKSLFGIIMTKKADPESIIKNISKIMLTNKSLALHLMESANLLNKNLNSSITSFNTPFEKVLFTQMVTSNLKNDKISVFINDTLISSVIEGDNSEFNSNESNFLFAMKRRNLIKSLTDYNEAYTQPLMKMLNIDTKPSKNKIPNLFKKSDFRTEFIKIIEKSNSLDDLKNNISSFLKEHVEKEIVADQKKFFSLTNDVLFFTLFIDDYSSEKEDEFVESFQKQTLAFTKILKFISPSDNSIKTGSIINNLSGEDYLLCITPLCDIERPEKVGNKFKFLVGEKVQKPKIDELKNTKNNCYFMPAPLESDLFYIKWNFYDTCTISLSELEEKRALITLKKDYIQNIINRYIAYQSRAGINEIFYKESNYISNFKNLI